MTRAPEETATWKQWSPLLGDYYARQMVPMRRRQYLFLAGLVASFALMVGSIFLLKDSALLWPAACLFFLLTIATYFGAALQQVPVVRSMVADLRASGRTVTHLPAIQSAYTFSKWLTSNQLDAAKIDAAAKAAH